MPYFATANRSIQFIVYCNFSGSVPSILVFFLFFFLFVCVILFLLQFFFHIMFFVSLPFSSQSLLPFIFLTRQHVPPHPTYVHFFAYFLLFCLTASFDVFVWFPRNLYPVTVKVICVCVQHHVYVTNS